MKKLRNQNGLTLTEMLCTVIIVLLFSSLVAVGANAAVRSFRISMADSQAQELCSTLTTAISDKLRYCTVETDAVFIQGVGYVKGTAENIFTVAFQIEDRRDTKLAEADFQVKQINQETN